MVSSPQHEPTMEEILASIRKIISEDSTEQQPPAAEVKPAPVAEAVPEPEPEADILDLTQVVDDEPVAPAFEPPAPEPEPVMEAAPEQDVVFEPIEEEPAAELEPAPAPAGNDIFSDKTRQSIDDAFAALDEPEEEMAAAAPSPMRATAGGGSVEAVFENAVREAFEPVAKEWLGANAPQLIEKMKPLIREWMDEHFPALLEGAVREEVARVARSRGTKH